MRFARSIPWPIPLLGVGALAFLAAMIGSLVAPLAGGAAAAIVAMGAEFLNYRARQALRGELAELHERTRPRTQRERDVADAERRRQDASAARANDPHSGVR